MEMKSFLVGSKILGTLVLAIVLIAGTSAPTGGPCGTDAFLEGCAPALGDYLFMKTFPVQPEKAGEKAEVRYILSKGSSYRIVICDEDEKGNKMKVRLLDRNHKLIATNYVSGKYYSTLDYNCSATGVYYIESGFKPSKVGCGAIILGFLK